MSATRKTRNPGVFRRADQHRQLSGVGPRHQGRSGDRSGARLRSPQRQGDRRIGRCHPGRGARSAASKSVRCWRRTPMPTICRARPISSSRPAPRSAIGEHIRDVQRIFRPVFNATDVSGDGSEFDHLFKDGERFKIGAIDAEVIYTPGHTPACVSYKIGDAVFVGDTMFMPDYGTARADFPGGDARTLYRSIQRILVAAAADAAVHVPRLQGARPRSVCLGDDGRRGAGTQCPCARRRERGRVRRDAQRARRQRWRHRCCCCRRSRSTSAPASFRRPKRTACII